MGAVMNVREAGHRRRELPQLFNPVAFLRSSADLQRSPSAGVKRLFSPGLLPSGCFRQRFNWISLRDQMSLPGIPALWNHTLDLPLTPSVRLIKSLRAFLEPLFIMSVLFTMLFINDSD